MTLGLDLGLLLGLAMVKHLGGPRVGWLGLLELFAKATMKMTTMIAQQRVRAQEEEEEEEERGMEHEQKGRIFSPTSRHSSLPGKSRLR